MKFRRFSRLPCSVLVEQCQGQSWSLFLGPTNDEANPAPQNPLVEPILPSPAVQTANNIDGASSSRRTCGKFGLCSIYFCGEFVSLLCLSQVLGLFVAVVYVFGQWARGFSTADIIFGFAKSDWIYNFVHVLLEWIYFPICFSSVSQGNSLFVAMVCSSL